MPATAPSATATGKSSNWLSWLLILFVCGLSGASILVVLKDFYYHSRSNSGVAAETYLFLYSSVALGLLSIIYQVSQRHIGRTAATILAWLPALGLTALIGSTDGWSPKYGWSTAAAQVAKSEPTSIYTYAEQMPELATGGGLASLCDTLSSQAQRQLNRAGQSATGTVRLSWVVSPQGDPSQIQIEQGLTAVVDSAVVAAVRGLPALQPGKQNGQQVAVRLTVIARFPALSAARIKSIRRQ